MKIKLGILIACVTLMLSACSVEEAKIEKVESTPATTTNTSNATTTTPVEEPVKEEAVKEEPAVTAPEVFKIGDSVTFDDLVITLNSVEDNKGDDFLKPADGSIYKIVDVTVENKGSEEKLISSILQTSMADAEGYKYTVAITTAIKTQLDGSVAAGRKFRGQVAYEVPKDAQGLEFIFSDPFSKGQAIWSLK